MTKKQVQNLIYSCLTPVLSEEAFRLQKSEGGFVRPIAAGRQYVGVPLWDYNPVFEFSLVMGVRIEKVEDIVNRFSGSPAKYQSGTETATFQLDRFMRKETTTFRATSESELQTALSQLLPVIKNQIIPFLDEHQDLLSLAEEMNLNEIRKSVPGAAYAMGPVTVARLIDSPNFLAIVEGYRQRVSRLPKTEMEKFEKLVQYLKILELNSTRQS